MKSRVIIRYDDSGDWARILKNGEAVWSGHYSDLAPDELQAILANNGTGFRDIIAVLREGEPEPDPNFVHLAGNNPYRPHTQCCGLRSVQLPRGEQVSVMLDAVTCPSWDGTFEGIPTIAGEGERSLPVRILHAVPRGEDGETPEPTTRVGWLMEATDSVIVFRTTSNPDSLERFAGDSFASVAVLNVELCAGCGSLVTEGETICVNCGNHVHVTPLLGQGEDA